MSKANNIVPYSGNNSKRNYKGSVSECEWNACIDKLRREWSRLMLSNDDIETVIKIASKLP